MYARISSRLYLGLDPRVGSTESRVGDGEIPNIILKSGVVTPTLQLTEFSLSIPSTNLSKTTYPITDSYTHLTLPTTPNE